MNTCHTFPSEMSEGPEGTSKKKNEEAEKRQRDKMHTRREIFLDNITVSSVREETKKKYEKRNLFIFKTINICVVLLAYVHSLNCRSEYRSVSPVMYFFCNCIIIYIF